MDSGTASTGQSSGQRGDVNREAQAAARGLRDKGRQTVEATKYAAADQAHALAGAVESAADQLGSTNQTLAHYARDLSRGIASAAEQLGNRSIEELLLDARRLAARNPTLFVLGSVGVGIVLSRFLKASAHRHPNGPVTSRASERATRNDPASGVSHG